MNNIDVNKLEQNIKTAETEINLTKVQINEIDKNVSISKEEKDKRKASKQEDLNYLINDYNYNRVLMNLYQIKTFDYNSISSKEKIEEKLDTYRKIIIEANRTLPLNMLKDILEKLEIKESDFDDMIKLSTDKVIKTNYKEEFDNLSKELNDMLGGRILSEIGINDLEIIISKYSELNKKRIELFDSLNEDMKNHPALFDENLKKELKESYTNLYLGLDSRITGTNIILKTKKEEKATYEEKIQRIDIELAHAELKRINAESELAELKKNDSVNKEAISSKSQYIKKLEEYIENQKSIKSQINDNIEILINGGNVKDINMDVEIPLETPVKQQNNTPPTPDSPERSEPKPEVAPIANTIEGLKANKILPNNLDDGAILYICSKLGIEVNDVKTELNQEQIERLQNDHQIQRALINEKIYERNQKKIAEYDELIAKYEMILKDKLKTNTFTQEYINKVNSLLNKLKEEKNILVEKNSKITSYDHSSIFENDIETNLDKRVTNKNEKLRSNYLELDELREERKNARSKFKQKRLDKRIEKKLARIEVLKSKQGKITSKQTEIINKNTDKYINKVTSRYTKYLEKQKKIEKSADKILDISERIRKSHEEQQNVQYDRLYEEKPLERFGLDRENNRINREIDRLVSEQEKVEREIGRMR